MIEGDSREQRVSALLRQLWLGLSAYRLYPGATDRAGFVAAAERIETAAARALADGVVDVEVHGEALWVEARPLPSEDATRRLALACFERRIERLVVRDVPSTVELAHLFDVLTLVPSELEDAGAADERLRAMGVTAFELLRIGPAPVSGADHAPEDMIDGVAEIPDADVLASELMVEDLGGDAEQQAETVLARLHSLAAELNVEPARGIDLHGAFHDAIDRFPADVRRSLVELLVDRVTRDPLAERLVGTMSNAELTRALVDLGRDGKRDPVDLARRLAAAGVRHLDIVDLTSALEAGREEAGTILAGLEQLGIDPSGPKAAGSVTDVIAGYLAATRSEDARAMKRALTAGEDGGQAAVLAFGDYLGLETDLERVGEVLDVWSRSVADSLRDRDRVRVGILVDAARGSLSAEADDRSALFQASARHALEPELLIELAQAPSSEETSPLPALLGPFGDVAVEVLLDVLAEEHDRDRRALLLSVLRQAAAGHVGPVEARLNDPRWYVVRNAVTVLGATGGPDVLDRLADAARHGAPEVRREAARALVLAGGVAAVPYLVELAQAGGDEIGRLALVALAALAGSQAVEALAEIATASTSRPLRQQALDVIAGRPDAGEALQGLAAGRTDPKLPWGLRRHARRLLRERRRTA